MNRDRTTMRSCVESCCLWHGRSPVTDTGGCRCYWSEEDIMQARSEYIGFIEKKALLFAV